MKKQRILTHFSNKWGNPFPGKSVHLQTFDANFWQALATTVVLLERFGGHVIHLEIEHLGDIEDDIVDLEMYRNILRCLTLVPNLRSLVFIDDFDRVADPVMDAFFGDLASQELFPELPNLEIFEWRMKFQVDSVWITSMLESYGKKERPLKHWTFH